MEAVIVQAISAILVTAGLFYTARQLQLSLEVQKQNHDWNRRNAAQIANLEHSIHFSGADKLIKNLDWSISKESIPFGRLKEKFESDEELRLICNRLLNYHESLAVGIANQVYDEKVIRDFRKSAITIVFNKLRNYVDHVRKEVQPSAWSEQEKLINKWNHEDNKDSSRNPTA